MGRPTRYSKAVVEKILTLMSMGYSLNKICSYSDMPAFPTVQRWLREPDKKDFKDKYTHAREARTEKIEDEILDIADNVAQPVLIKGKPILVDGEPIMTVDNAAIQHARLRVDTRHRHLEAMKPKVYGKHAGLGDEIQTGLLAKMKAAQARVDEFNKKTGRLIDNATGEVIDG